MQVVAGGGQVDYSEKSKGVTYDSRELRICLRMSIFSS